MMIEKRLKFSPDLVPSVLEGSKTSTWRVGDDKNLSEGDILSMVNSKTGEIFTRGKITSVVEKPLGQLTDEDRVGHEKFENEEEMYRTYSEYYNKPVSSKTKIKIVRYQLIP